MNIEIFQEGGGGGWTIEMARKETAFLFYVFLL